MARSVLMPALRWTGLAVLVLAQLAARSSAAPQQACAVARPGRVPATAEPEIHNLEERVKAGPFYRELVTQLGKPASCTLEFDDGRIGLTFAFARRAQLIVRTDRKIESNEQRIQIPRMEMAKAMSLLQAAEKDAYRPNGCGIAWDHADEDSVDERTGSHELVYRGGTCNCQARVTSRNNYAVSLVLKSAC